MRPGPAVYVATAAAFAVADAIWLGLVATDFYRGEIGRLMLPSPRWLPAVAFYLVYVVAVVRFVVAAGGRTGRVALRGAGFGLACYGTYDLTNLATLTDWTVRMAAVDIAWGMTATAVAAVVGHAVARRAPG